MRRNRFLALAALLSLACGAVVPASPVHSTVGAQSASVPANLPAREVVALCNLEYSRPGGRPLRLDLYRPRAADGPLPLVVWIHGGGWRSGSKSPCPAAWMAQHGYVVAGMDYRLSGEATFPAQIVDCKAAVRWLRAHAAEYGIDPNRIGAWGASAGGHLAALLGVTGDVALFESPEHEEYSSRVQAVCDFFGPAHLVLSGTAADPGVQGMRAITQLLGGPAGELYEKAALASPITFVTPDDPPFLIVHGSRDRVVPLAQSRLLFEALQNAGVEAALHVVEGAGHGFRTFHVDDIVLEFFNRHLKGPGCPPGP